MESSRKRNWPRIAIILIGCLIAAESVLLYLKWPFTSERMANSLAGSTGSRVRFNRFRQTFLPHPGCNMEEVTFERGTQTLARVRELKVVGSWAALFALQHYISVLDLERAEVRLPSQVPAPEPPPGAKQSQTTIGELRANGAVLQIEREAQESGPLTLTFPKLHLRNVSKENAIGFDIDVGIPQPNGRLLASGSIGPWQGRQTKTKGSFRIRDAKLGGFENLDGAVSAEGEFKGLLEKIQVTGHTDTPDFRVKRHRIHLQTDYSATVNASNGNVSLDSIVARFLRTVLQAKGGFDTKQGGSGKTVWADFSSDRARIEDLMRLVTMGDQPAMNGPITLQAHAELPPGEGKFLRKLRLDGDFTITNANFTKARTQAKVSEMSARSRGRDVGEDEPTPERALSDLKGHVVLRDGTATLSRVSFALPGAIAHGGGTYDLISKKVNLSGQVAMDATVSEASSGLKSVLLKPFNAIFKRKNAGAVLPVSVTGYYPRPKFQVSLGRK